MLTEVGLVITRQLGRFVEECCVVADSFSTRARPLYECFRQWAEGAGESAVSETLGCFCSVDVPEDAAAIGWEIIAWLMLWRWFSRFVVHHDAPA